MLWLISNPIFQLVAGAMISFGGSVWANYLFYGKVASLGRPSVPTSLRPVVLLINEQGEKEKGRDEWQFSWCSFLRGFGWRGTERRRAKRAAAQWSGSQSGRRFAAVSRPDPEVVAKPKRRTFTAEYKQRILMEAEAALPHQVASALCSAGKVCTRLCWPIGGESGPMEFARL